MGLGGAFQGLYLGSMNAQLDRWFDELPEEWQERAEQLRHMLRNASPAMAEERKHDVPCYTHRRWMCYLSFQKGRLILAFLQGKQLLDTDGLLAHTDHKLVRQYMVPPKGSAFDTEALHRLVLQAVLVNEAMTPARRKPVAHKARFR